MALEKNFALCVGVEEFQMDAVAMAAVLRDPAVCGFPPDNVVLLTGQTATRDEVLKQLGEIRRKIIKVHLKQKCTFIFYFSGHGSGKGVDSLAVAGGGRLSRQDLQLELEAIRPIVMQLLSIYDCCFAEKNGAIHIKDVKADSVTSHIQAQLKQLSENLSGAGLAYLQWSSSRADEVSFGRASGSVFTGFLIAGLKGGKECALNGKKCEICNKFRQHCCIENFVTTDLLKNFLVQHVKQYTEKFSNSLMHPNFAGISEEAFPLAIYKQVITQNNIFGYRIYYLKRIHLAL